MKSRMERIYEKTATPVENTASRSSRNKETYKRMYEDETYTNIEGTIETKSNEIDLDKVKELVLRHEEEENAKTRLVKRDVKIDIPIEPLEEEDKNYDIMDVLKHAKEEQKDSRENKYRSLDEEYLEDLKNPTRKVEKVPLEEDIKEIKSLLNTLTSSMDLKKLKDSEVALDMFTDLKDTKSVDKDDPVIKALIDDASKKEEQEEEIDKTFDTTNMKLKVTDYADEDEDDEKTPVALKVFLAVLILVLLIIVGYIVYKLLMK